MAHPAELRNKLRGLFVFKRLPMEVATKKVGIPKSTGTRWKLEAKNAGDDWDNARAAVSLSDDTFSTLSKKLLEDYLTQHQATMDVLRDATNLSAMERANTLASMSDSFNKTMNSFKRLAPDVNKQAVALDVLARFTQFAQTRYPQHIGVLLEMLEPFGEVLATKDGSHG